MKQTKDLLKAFEELEMKKNQLAERYHNSLDKTLHFHVLEQIVKRQIKISLMLQERVKSFNGNQSLQKTGSNLFKIIDHHLRQELEKIYAKNMEGVYDLVEDINENYLKEKVVATYFLNLGCEKDFDCAIDHLENNRVYSFIRPKLLGLAVALSVMLSGTAKSVLDEE